MSISSAQPAAVRRAGAFGVHSLYRFAFTVPDLDEAERFYWAFGLSPRRIGDRLDLYTHGHPHCWASIHQNGAQKKLQYVSYAVYEEDFDAFRSRIERLGLQCEPHPLCGTSREFSLDTDGRRSSVSISAITRCASALWHVLSYLSRSWVRRWVASIEPGHSLHF